MPRGWEDYWGRARRVQYPTTIYAMKAATGWYSYATWGVVRTFERDLEFNIPTPWVQLRLEHSWRAHAKKDLTADRTAYFRAAIYWNDSVKAYTTPMSVTLLSGYSACTYTGVVHIDDKIGVTLDDYFWRGKVKVEFQSYVSDTDEFESQMTDDLNKIEVGTYEW